MGTRSNGGYKDPFNKIPTPENEQEQFRRPPKVQIIRNRRIQKCKNRRKPKP